MTPLLHLDCANSSILGGDGGDIHIRQSASSSSSEAGDDDGDGDDEDEDEDGDDESEDEDEEDVAVGLAVPSSTVFGGRSPGFAFGAGRGGVASRGRSDRRRLRLTRAQRLSSADATEEIPVVPKSTTKSDNISPYVAFTSDGHDVYTLYVKKSEVGFSCLFERCMTLIELWSLIDIRPVLLQFSFPSPLFPTFLLYVVLGRERCERQQAVFKLLVVQNEDEFCCSQPVRCR